MTAKITGATRLYAIIGDPVVQERRRLAVMPFARGVERCVAFVVLHLGIGTGRKEHLDDRDVPRERGGMERRAA